MTQGHNQKFSDYFLRFLKTPVKSGKIMTNAYHPTDEKRGIKHWLIWMPFKVEVAEGQI